MIVVKNTQRTIMLNLDRVKHDLQHILTLLDYSDFDVGLWLTTDRTIKYYNHTYRDKNKPTDILSFAYHPELKAGARIRAKTPEDKNLGDMLISVPYVQREAINLGVTLEQRLRVLLVHGVCHLLGYDHIYDADYRRMRAKEAYILKALQEL